MLLVQNVTGVLDCEVLEQDLIPHIHNHFANNSVLVDDNAAPHMESIVHEYLTGEDIMQVDWPLYSPDMNTVERIWDELDH